MKKLVSRIAIVALVFFSALIIYFLTTLTINQKKDAGGIQQIRSLNRWETTSYTVEQIIDNQTTGNAFQQFLFGDKILLIAHGIVTAGFDLASLSNKNIHTNGNTITLDLPATQILATSLDESQTRVYDRQKGFLAPTNDNLEENARIEAVNKIRHAACSGGVLQNASDNAKKQLTSLLQSLGFTTVTFTIPQGHC